MILALILTAVIGYFLGNCNGAICVSRILHDDVRSHGSGNAGLTNFIRSYGTGWAALVILIDMGKGVAACLIGGALLKPYGLSMEGMTLGGLTVMIGHDLPALMGFRGGKGILTGFSIALTIDWRIGVLIFAVFAVVYLLSQYVSLGSVCACVAFGAGFVLFHRNQPWVMAGGIVMALLAIFMHRGNILRLIKGQEPRTNLFKKKGSNE